MLFDSRMVGQVRGTNPVAAAGGGPKSLDKKGKTPVLKEGAVKQFLESIDDGRNIGLQDQVLNATTVSTFGRVGAVTAMKVSGRQRPV